MSDPFAADIGTSKADRLAEAINRLIYELTIRCTKSEAEGVRNYYEVGVIGYGAAVGPAWTGPLLGTPSTRRTLIPLREVADNPARLEERSRQVLGRDGVPFEEKTKFAVWFDAVANNGTPMSKAFEKAHALLRPWVNAHPASFPPIVINITDGESTDGDFRPAAESLKQLSTDDGEVLVFNIHISSENGSPCLYPEDDNQLDEFSRMLFQASSILPPHIRDAAKGEGYQIGPASKGFAFNADIVEVVKFLDIGTRAKALR